MKKICLYISLLSLLITIICAFSYNLIGSKVLSDGTLVEPFYLVVFEVLFFIIFVIFLVCYILKKK